MTLRRAGSEIRFVVVIAGLAALYGLARRLPAAALACGYLAGAVLIGAMFVKLGAYWNYFVEFGAAIALLTGLAIARARPLPLAGAAVMLAVLLQERSCHFSGTSRRSG